MFIKKDYNMQKIFVNLKLYNKEKSLLTNIS